MPSHGYISSDCHCRCFCGHLANKLKWETKKAAYIQTIIPCGCKPVLTSHLRIKYAHFGLTTWEMKEKGTIWQTYCGLD